MARTPARKRTSSPKKTAPARKFPSYLDMPMLGDLPNKDQAAAVRAMGDEATANALLRPKRRGKKQELFGIGGELRPWQYTSFQIGFTPLLPEGTLDPQPISPAALIKADPNLKRTRINIHLDHFHVFEYPGGGEHQILFTFQAQNQIKDAKEPVTFTQTYCVQQGESAPVTGQPIFLGLSVGAIGANFFISAMNVCNTNDQEFIGLLNSDPFKEGLNLLTTAQPVIAPFASLALGIANSFARRNENRKVHDARLGLDFIPAAGGARLAQGSYIVLQTPQANTVNWDEWMVDPGSGAVVRKDDGTILTFNYYIFRVSLYEE